MSIGKNLNFKLILFQNRAHVLSVCVVPCAHGCVALFPGIFYLNRNLLIFNLYPLEEVMLVFSSQWSWWPRRRWWCDRRLFITCICFVALMSYLHDEHIEMFTGFCTIVIPASERNRCVLLTSILSLNSIHLPMSNGKGDGQKKLFRHVHRYEHSVIMFTH